jgi:hypothetical protein
MKSANAEQANYDASVWRNLSELGDTKKRRTKMGLLERIRFNFWDPAGMVVSLIQKWKPTKCGTEKAYETALYSFLHRKLEDIQITRQYARGRIRADLVVGDKVIIELKNDLNSTAKYQRLIGQLSEYKEWEGHIIILLTGQTDPNLRKQLRKYVEKEDVNDDYTGGTFTIIEK